MSIHPVDIHVGKQLRIRRNWLRISQNELAKSVGVTFQQIQKYERGDNRISCSRLFELAIGLNCSVEYFFEGIDNASFDSLVTDEALIYEKEFFKLKEFFFDLSVDSQKMVMRLAKYLSTLDQ